MYPCLDPSLIGIDCTFTEAAALAAAHSFDGIRVDTDYLREHSVEKYQKVLQDHELRCGSVDLPTNITAEYEQYEDELAVLPEIAKHISAVGCDRCTTYILSYSDERPFEDNFEFHQQRLEPIAEILMQHDIELGLEFLGPQTLRDGHEHEFIHTANGMLELCSAIGTNNVGLLLDSWHWYTSGGRTEVLERLNRDDVVDMHINDAPSGIPLNEQQDSIRRLPGATGVIDIKLFIQHLDRMGYEGPVTAEPFSDEVDKMDDETAVARTAEAIQSALAYTND